MAAFPQMCVVVRLVITQVNTLAVYLLQSFCQPAALAPNFRTVKSQAKIQRIAALYLEKYL